MILVLGDTCIDRNYYGEIKRMSPEANVPVFSVSYKSDSPGMSDNVVKNLIAAGNTVTSFTKGLFYYPETIKNRYYSGDQYLYRIDEDNLDELLEDHKKYILYSLSNIKTATVAVLQDYNKGFFTPSFIKDIIAVLKSKSITIIADGHMSRDPSFYTGVDYLKLNQNEFETLVEKGAPSTVPNKALIVTKGSKGATIYRGLQLKHYPALEVNAVDVTGAGDTFVSWFASEIAKGLSENMAMTVAGIAAGISVEHVGCYAPTKKEVENQL